MEITEPTYGESPPKVEKDKFYSDALKSQLLRLKVEREARLILDQEALAASLSNGEIHHRMVYDPLPTAQPELIPGILPESGTLGIVGETNTGKSLIALEICSSLLTGQPLWGAIEPNRRIDRVVYILGEHTPETIQGLYHVTGLPKEGDFRLIGPNHLHPHKALVVGGVAQTIAIDRLIKWTEGAGLIVFDPLAGFIQGQAAENDNTGMRTLIDSMGLIAQANGSACLILSHMAKPMIDETGAEHRRGSYAMRGASGQEDALTHILYLRRHNMVKQQGPEEKFDLEVRKFKGNPTDDKFKLLRDPITKRNLLDGKHRARITPPNLEDKREIMDIILRVQRDNPMFNHNTVLGLVASMQGVPVAILKGWIGE